MSGIVGMGQPQDISNIVPGVDQLASESMQNAKGASMPASTAPPPQQPAAAPQGAPPDLDALYDQHVASQGAPVDLDALYDQSKDAVPDKPSYSQANLTAAGLGQQLSDMPTRAKASFALTPGERMAVLTDKFGDGNVRRAQVDGKDVYMVKEDGKWRRFGSNTELLGDMSDFSRMAAESAIAAPVTGAGLALAGGEAASGVGAPLAPATAGTAFAAGSMAGKAGGDYIAQNMLGIPRDPSRSNLLEYGVAGALGFVLGSAAQGITNKLAANAAMKPIEAASLEQTTRTIEENLANAQDLQKAGLVANIPGQDTNILAHEAAPNNPQLLRMSMGFEARSPEYVKLQQARAASLEDGYARLAGNFGNAEVIVNPELANNLHPRFQEAVKGLDYAEGAMLGDYREMASNAGNKQPLSVDNYKGAVIDLAKRMGFGISQDNKSLLNVPDVQTVIRKGIVSTPREAAQLLQDVNGRLEDAFNNGANMSYGDMMGEYKALTQRINRSSTLDGSGMRSELIALKDGMRDDVNKWTGNLLQNFDPEAGQMYQQALSRFSELKSNQETLGNLIKGDSLNAQAFADKLFYSQKSPGMVDAVKTLIAKDDPKLWDDMVSTFFNNRIADNKDSVTGAINWQKAYDQIFHPTKGVGPEVLQQMLGSPKDVNLTADQFGKFMKFAATFSKLNLVGSASSPGLSDAAAQTALRQFADASTTTMHGSVSQILRVVGSLYKTPESNQIAHYISKVGTEQALNILPPAQQGVWRQVFDGLRKLNPQLMGEGAGAAANKLNNYANKAQQSVK